MLNYKVCFAAYLRRQDRRESTIKSYSHALVEFCKYCGSQGKRNGIVRQMTPAWMESYKRHLLGNKGLRPSTVNQRLSALSAFGRFLVAKSILNHNPFDLVARVGCKPLSSEELHNSWDSVQRLRAEVHKDVINVRDRALVELLYADLSVRELCSLRYEEGWSSDNEIIQIGDRKVTLHARACLALEHYGILRPILKGDYLLVGSGPGWSMKPGQIYATVRKLARMAGVSIGVKDLRLARYVGEVYGFEPAAIPAAVAA